jgi:hypothetical protein
MRETNNFTKHLEPFVPRDFDRIDESHHPPINFLAESVHVMETVQFCEYQFSHEGDLSANVEQMLWDIAASSFVLLMSHFEIFQRELFADIVRIISYDNPSNDDAALAKRLEKVGCKLDIERVLAQRYEPKNGGQLIADSMPGWHSPERVNGYFGVLLSQSQFFSRTRCADLTLLWQLRHSIVHTGGWLSREDAAKVRALEFWGDKPILFKSSFIEEVVRQFHEIVEDGLKQLARGYKQIFLSKDYTAEHEDIACDIFRVDSPRRDWLRNPMSSTEMHKMRMANTLPQWMDENQP